MCHRHLKLEYPDGEPPRPKKTENMKYQLQVISVQTSCTFKGCHKKSRKEGHCSTHSKMKQKSNSEEQFHNLPSAKIPAMAMERLEDFQSTFQNNDGIKVEANVEFPNYMNQSIESLINSNFLEEAFAPILEDPVDRF